MIVHQIISLWRVFASCSCARCGMHGPWLMAWLLEMILRPRRDGTCNTSQHRTCDVVARGRAGAELSAQGMCDCACGCTRLAAGSPPRRWRRIIPF